MKTINKDLAKDLYYNMILSRKYEEKANNLYREGNLNEKPLSGIGQEGVAIGATYPLEKNDFVLPSLRTKGAFLTKGISPKECFLELFKKDNSLSEGHWTSHHLGDLSRGVILSSAVVASSLPVATGVAFSLKLKEEDNVVLAFFGDGAASRGDFHTSINLASVQNLPIVFVCENNLYALSTRIEDQMKNEDVADRSIGYGIPGDTVDGQDVFEVLFSVEKAIQRARKGLGPSLIECKTYRFRGHTESHEPIDGRSQKEYDNWREKCPLKIFKKRVNRNINLSEEFFNNIEAKAETKIENALENAQEKPDPAHPNIEDYVYS